jgi:hypothetical protein
VLKVVFSTRLPRGEMMQISPPDESGRSPDLWVDLGEATKFCIFSSASRVSV